MAYFTSNGKMKPEPIPRPVVLHYRSVVGYECYNPVETNLMPNTVNLIDTGFIINFPDSHVLKLEPVSYTILNKYIFPTQNNNLIIPIITSHFKTLPAKTLICRLRFLPITDVVSLRTYGKNIYTYIIINRDNLFYKFFLSLLRR